MAEIRCENIWKSYGKGAGRVDAVRGVTATFSGGKFYSIIGKSGSGKSTLLYLLSGILSPDCGDIYYNNVRINSAEKKKPGAIKGDQVGFVFQDYQLLPEFTLRENIILPLVLNNQTIDEQWYKKIIQHLDIEALENRFPQELSGGQQQRVVIGRAVIHRPPFIFADEPTGNLDKKSSRAVLDLLLEIRNLYDPMILLVTHDLDIARSADEILSIEDGMIHFSSMEATE